MEAYKDPMGQKWYEKRREFVNKLINASNSFSHVNCIIIGQTYDAPPTVGHAKDDGLEWPRLFEKRYELEVGRLTILAGHLIPCPTTLHGLVGPDEGGASMRGRQRYDWETQHWDYIEIWRQLRNYIITGAKSTVMMDVSDPYLRCRSTLSLLTRLRSFSSIDDAGGGRRLPVRGEQVITDGASDHRFDDRNGRQKPPHPIPNRPLRSETPIYQHLSRSKFGLAGKDGDGGHYENSKPFGVGGNRTNPQSPGSDLFLFDKFDSDDGWAKKNKNSQTSEPRPSAGKGEDQGNDFLEKFKLGFDKGEKPLPNASPKPCKAEDTRSEKAMHEPPLPPPLDADEIFKKMKETGLIPNAVAMLDGLCKDGLVQEAMKLFGLMREKGTIPEVVIYTAVVEGFCKAHKLDDATRIFRKMQNSGISPNAFSYAVLIQGLYKSKRLDDALDFCGDLLEAGHSPNLATFTGLVEWFCREKGVEEAQSMIRTLKQKGFLFDEKTVREYLDKKGPFLPLVWEAIFGKKSSNKFF
ncbi:hypothetical protein F0562_028382 [Nyssa sinensis]|uniref:Pentacotripeptide-repeat region of PRORP domain-containing protein n=1 Tax=Nyssa sinensis TaxID=561372 RepID=A0A5J5AZW6_9ASTE|nr:hypothetical protein F0562_028382 [Nyssa sinensis]